MEQNLIFGNTTTLCLNGRHWTMKAAANMVALQEDFSRTQLRDAVAVDGGRSYGETIRIGIGNDAGYVCFYLSDKSPFGCRFVARGLVLLARLAGGVAQLPEQICFIASGRPWAVRGVITMQQIASAECRRALDATYSHLHLPAFEGRGEAGEYARRAVETVMASRPDCESIEPSRVRRGLHGIRNAEPDGLLRDRRTGKLTIIEAKKDANSFVEGIAQLLQYRGMIAYAVELQGSAVESFLVTGSGVENQDLEVWQQLVESRRDFRLMTSGFDKFITLDSS